ncbi:hypothetical protein DQ04_06511010 [Trypanosoma grayi]|uniref:hypothetical protein n=1 Tax=Trypanosoma grayi TaxID=71804 RepID=UPI0004F42AFA|nr:hypothetical protein DQ04_06511010 [Trypanosoma grayi]KEG08747.1 hypothetical protein DQ04_06511010 [Trypanosoma grayi]
MGESRRFSRASTLSSSDDVAHTAAEELAAQIDDCASLLPCIDAAAAVRSIRPLTPRGRTVTACVPWRTSEKKEEGGRSVEVRFGYSEAFTCGGLDGDERIYESLIALLVAHGCGVPGDA